MLARIAVVLAVAIPLAWFFGRAICTDEMFGYRDAAHYYYPFYWYVHEHWAHGIVPLWNPLENLGQPLAADPTAAAFYPGKVIFFLPFAYDWLYKVYIVGHVVLCAVTTYWLARQWQASRPAAGLAAVAYAFGGSVFFQYANVVFLVGAAWLPLAMWGAHRIVVKRDWWGVLGFAFATAMMVLGGDLEAAYLVSLAALLLGFLEWRRQATVGRAVSPSSEPEIAESPEPGRANSPSYITLLSAAFALAFGLSAIQLVPSIVWGQKTERAIFDSPRSIYEIPSYLARPSEPEDPPLADDPPAEPTTWYGGMIGPPPPHTHDSDLYRYSVGPWRFVELLWPNFYGREFPENRRWGSVLPQEESPWTPSLYFGLIPLLLMLTQLAFWSGPIRSRWLTWTLLILTLGSLGSYGLVWLVREAIYLTTGTAIDPPLNEAAGGVYWFFTVFLPGFVQFRYPAKLLVLAILCAALLAARGLDRAIGSRWLWAGALVVALVSCHCLLSLAAFPGTFDAAIDKIAQLNGQHNWHFGLHNRTFGPLDQLGARWDLMSSLIQALVLSLLIAGSILILRRTDKASDWHPWPAVALLLLTALDLCNAHGWSVVLASSSVSAQARALQRSRPDPAQHQGDLRPVVKVRGDQWMWTRSPDRMSEIIAEDVAHQNAKYNLLAGMRGLNSWGSAGYPDSSGLWEYFRDFNSCAVSEDEPSVVPPLRVVSSTVLHRRANLITGLAGPHREHFAFFDDYGSAWVWGVVIETDARPAFCSSEHRASADHPYRQSRWSFRERPDKNGFDDVFSQPSPWSLDFLHDEAGYEATLVKPSWLVFPEQYDPDFACEVTDLATGEKSLTPIYRAQRVLRGIHVPAGKFEVRFLYRPWSFYLGAALSLLAWPLAAWLVWRRWRAE